MGGPLDVFGLGAYDFAIDWSQAEYVLDAGANIGSFTLFAAARGAQRIVAVEPHPATFALLVENIRIAGLERRLMTINGAVAATPGSRTLSITRMSTAATLLAPASPNAKEVVVRATTLAEILRETGWPRIDLMKIDIEGAEYEVFRDLPADVISAVDTVIIECHHLPGVSPDEVAVRLRDADFYVAAEVDSNSTMIVATKGRLLHVPGADQAG